MTSEELKTIILAKYIQHLEHVVSETADFFDEGGDSVAVEVILSELSEIVGADLPGWLLLDNPSALQLSNAIHDFIKV
jgi:hypothetical protein